MKRAILTLSLIALSSSRLFAADPMLQEYSEALALEREAEKGDKEAALKLGRFYDSNLSNEAKAIHWFSKRCGRWNSKCAFDIGRIYQLDSNYVKAKFWFEKAYKMGSADGAFMTGVVISEYESDEETAMKWYEIAHKMGSKDAGIEIGFIYYGLYDDLEKAAEWYEKSYKLGNLKAVIKLGMLYRDDIKDYKKALEWFMIAYKNKLEGSASCIGGIYFRMSDYPNAIKWRSIEYDEEIARKRPPSALAETAFYLAQAYKFNKDYPNAIKWYKISHNKRYNSAAYFLAKLYDETLKDYPNAIKWYEIANARNNDKKNIEAIARLKQALSEQDQNATEPSDRNASNP